MADSASVPVTTNRACPSCGRERREVEACCALCGHLFERAQAPAAPEPRTAPALPTTTCVFPSTESPPPGNRERYVYVGLGLLTAPVFAFTPLLQYMGWFLASLTHEMGHAAMAWFFGSPAYPAIRLDGHAAAFHEPQKAWLVGLIALGLGAAGVHFAKGAATRVAFGILIVSYLALAFTSLHESLFLLAGHGAELAFGAVFLWRCATGGFTSSGAERILCGTLGWYLLGSNLVLSAGLLFSSRARHDYAGNGSFGLTNDYLRMDLPLPLIAGGMGLVALCVIPLVLVVASRYGAAADDA